MEIRNFSQSEWNNDIFHDFSGIWRGEALRELIGNMTSANLNDIFLFKEQNERCEEIADDESVQTENTKLSYFVARRCLNELWQFVRSVGETELGAAIHRRVDNGAEVVIVRCVDFPTLTSRLSVLGSWRNYRFVVPVTHIWLCNDGDFCIELGAETDLRHFLKESAKDFCVRHIVYKMVELHKYSWETKLLWYPSNFVIDIDGNLNMIPRGRLCRKDVCDRESVHVFICGKNLFSITSVPGLCGKDEEKIIQSCMDPEKDRPTFSSLLTNLSSDNLTTRAMLKEKWSVTRQTTSRQRSRNSST